MKPDTDPTEAVIRLALHEVLDPEMGESIVDLGLSPSEFP